MAWPRFEDQLTALLADAAPHLPRRAWTHLSAGAEHDVWLSGDGYLLRVARCRDGLDMDAEVRLLRWVAPRLPVAVPNVEWHGQVEGRAAMTYRRVEGTPVTSSTAAMPLLGTDLARVLTHLHASIPPWWDGLELHGWQAGVRAARALLDEHFAAKPFFRAEAWVRASELLGTALADEHIRPALIHGDLCGENVLVSDEGHLAGLLDFGGCCVADPAWDVAWVGYQFGATALHNLRRTYAPTDAGFVERVHAYLAAMPFVGLYESLERPQPKRTL